MEAAGINPYDYEPQRNVPLDVESRGSSSSENDDEHQVDVSDNVDRLGNTHWCSCERCNSLPKPNECVCCREMLQLQNKLMGIPCITEHHDFAVACLTPVVLRIAIVARNDMRRDDFQEWSNE